MTNLDGKDIQILDILQRDATTPIAEIAEAVALSTTPCWRRIQNLEKKGIIRGRVALLDKNKLNVGVTVFMAVRAPSHAVGWLENFKAAIMEFPEIVEAYRLSGDIDYILRSVVPSIEAYDALYKALIQRVEFSDVSSSFSMEELKFTTALPTKHARK